MKSKHLLLLVIAFAILAMMAKYSQKQSPAPKDAAGGKLLDFDLNAVEKFTLTSGTQAVTVARNDGTWTVPSLGGYPADFDEVADNLRKLGQLKGDVIRGGENQLDEFGLASANADYLSIRFLGTDSKELGAVELGSPHLGGAESYPDGQYVRANSGAVLLVNEYLGGFPRRPEDWVEKELLKVSRADISYVMVRNGEAAPYGLMSDAGGAWKLSDLKDGETMNTEAAGNVAGALSFLNLLSVADPATPTDVSGSEYVAKATNGVVYTVKTGGAIADGRFAAISVGYEGSDTNEIARTKIENDRLSKWVYVLPESAAQNLAMARSQLVMIKTSAAETTTTTSPPPVSPTPAN